jgi:hypothetical protein
VVFEAKLPTASQQFALTLPGLKIPMLAAPLTTGLVQECQKYSLHGAPPERSLTLEKILTEDEPKANINSRFAPENSLPRHLPGE